MSLHDGLAALNLEMPARVPRTEYSAESHWPLVQRVTGIQVDSASPAGLRQQASSAFMKAWNYDFSWNTLVGGQIFGDLRTKMGHAVYAQNGTDYSDEVSCPFDDPEDALAFDPWQAYGEIDLADVTKQFEENYASRVACHPDVVNMTGIYTTCISGLLEIFGWDMLLMALGVDPEGFGRVADRYASWIQQYFDALAESSVPTVMIHDDIVWTEGAFVNPEWYRKYVFPNYKKLFAPLLEAGKRIIYTSDGNYTAFVDDIAATGVHGFVMEPTTDMGYIAEKYGRTHVFIGNADTRILLGGTREEIYAEVKRCMDIGKSCPGFFMAVGNHIPANTPVENALYYNAVYEKLARR